MATRKACYAQLTAQLDRLDSGYHGPAEYIHWPDDKRTLLPGFTAPAPEPVRVTRGRGDDRQSNLFEVRE